ncbi:hypothetical protein L596_002390 [Steinernema carpocapsae]|uniref:Uncharacterized protein n=1 Tax=Steinernema carpocapsae TaxID=34508 RepID=A0A4U8URU5_STECR|nr:hypothetical protein L596_002390 [Steinernema carpocapsae]
MPKLKKFRPWSDALLSITRHATNFANKTTSGTATVPPGMDVTSTAAATSTNRPPTDRCAPTSRGTAWTSARRRVRKAATAILSPARKHPEEPRNANVSRRYPNPANRCRTLALVLASFKRLSIY